MDFLVAIGGRDWHNSKEVAFAGRGRGLGRGLVAIGAAPPRRREDGMEGDLRHCQVQPLLHSSLSLL